MVNLGNFVVYYHEANLLWKLLTEKQMLQLSLMPVRKQKLNKANCFVVDQTFANKRFVSVVAYW